MKKNVSQSGCLGNSVEAVATPMPKLYAHAKLELIHLENTKTSRSKIDEHTATKPESSIAVSGEIEQLPEGLNNKLVYRVECSISTVRAKLDLIHIEATFRVVYALQDKVVVLDEDIAEFARVFVLLNTWPYWREFVQSSTVRLGLPPLTLPLYAPLESGTPPGISSPGQKPD